MLDVRLAADGNARGFEPPHAELNAVATQNERSEAPPRK
jgi:hypothetical protein